MLSAAPRRCSDSLSSSFIGGYSFVAFRSAKVRAPLPFLRKRTYFRGAKGDTYYPFGFFLDFFFGAVLRTERAMELA